MPAGNSGRGEPLQSAEEFGELGRNAYLLAKDLFAAIHVRQ